MSNTVGNSNNLLHVIPSNINGVGGGGGGSNYDDSASHHSGYGLGTVGGGSAGIIGGGGGESSQIEPSVTQKSRSSTSLSHNPLVLFERSFSIYISALRDTLESTSHLYSILIYSWVILQTLSLSSYYEYKWGNIGGWIMRGVAAVWTLGLDFMPYIGCIVIISLSLTINIITLFMLLYCKSALGNGSKNWDQLKRYVRKVCLFYIVFSVPMMYCYGVFWHCDYTTMNLFAFTDRECWSSWNSGLASISLLGAIMTLVITLISSLVLVDINPTSKGIFVSFSPIFVTALITSNALFAFLQQAIPPYIYYAVPSLFIVKQILLGVLLIKRYPFFRRIENSIMFGILIGSGMWAVANLVSYSIHMNVPSIDVETSGLIVMGVGFSLPIIGFLIGFISVEIATRVIVSNVKNRLYDLVNDPECELSDMKYMHLFVQWAMKNHTLAENVRCLINEVSSTKLELQFIDLVTCACYMHYLVEDFQTSALLLIKKSEDMFDTVWFIDRLELQIRKREITTHIHAESAEVSEYLTKVASKQETIMILQRTYWKLVLSEEISEIALEQAARKMWNEINECRIILENLASRKRDKNVYRTYAKFLETFLLEKEFAEEYYERANQMEETDSRRRKIPHISFKNKVHPATLKEKIKGIDKRSYDAQLNTLEDLTDLDSASVFGERINPAEKQKDVYRLAIKKEDSNYTLLTLFLTLLFASIGVVVIAMIINLVLSTENTQLAVMVNSAPIPISSMNTLNEYRYIQKHLELYGSIEEETFVSIKDRLTWYTQMIGEMVKTVQQDYFTDEMKNDMLGTKSEVLLPSLAVDGSYTFSAKNMTYGEMLHLIHSVTSVLANSTLDTFRNTTNFEFIFLWSNRLLFIDYFEVFCDILTQRNFEHLESWSNIIIGTLSSVLGLYTIFLVVLWVIIGGYLKISSKLLRLYKYFPKNEVGKLYHEMEKRTSHLNQRIEFRKSNLFSPQNILIFLLVCVFVLTYLAVGLIFFEALYNSVYNRQAISKVQHGTEITHDLTKIIFGSFQSMFHDSEYLRYTHEELYSFAKEYNAMDQYSGFRYGTEEAGYYNLVGMTASIDSQVQKRATNSKCNNYTLINFDISQIECMSLDELIDADIYYLTKQVEDIYNKKYSEDQLLHQFWKNYLVYIETRKKSWSVMLESTEFFTSIINQRLISGLACALPVFVTFLLLVAFRYYNRINKERALYLLLLFQMPCDVLDNLDPVKNYIFNRSFDSEKKSKQADLDGRSEVRAICDAAVDGMILCTSAGAIEVFNNSSETMFGYKSTDVLGLALTKLFEKESRDKVDSILTRLRQSTESMGETLDLVCLRKNDRKFSARVSLSVSLLSTSNNMKKSVMTCFIKDITMELKHNNLIKEEKMKSEALLLNILPEPVANRLKAGETNIYENFKDVTCFFSDIVGFTTMSSTMEPNQVVSMLNEIVNHFDILSDSYDLEKIKTIGDAYFCAGGLHNCMQSDHPEKVVRFAIDTLGVIYLYNTQNATNVNIRVGVHTGSVVAGVLGIKKFAYDLWGDAVNTASRMESTGMPGRIQISRETYERVHDLFEFDLREIEVKGKGKMKTYVVKEKHHQNPNKEAFEISNTTILRKRLGEGNSTSNLFQSQRYNDNNHDDSAPNLQLAIPEHY